MEDKPIIRHCQNCKYCDGFNCTVKYQIIVMDRLKALLCRYYKAKEKNNNDTV